jgi:ubiquinone biosynthesis protein
MIVHSDFSMSVGSQSLDIRDDRQYDKANLVNESGVNKLALGGQTLLALARGRKRYLRAVRALLSVSSTYASWRATGKPEGLEKAHHRAGMKLAELARQNGGGWVKAAQFFSTRSDVLPKEYVQALQQLQNDAAPVPFKSLEKVLSRSLGARWQRHFREVDETPVATASIAQLHRARLKNGTDVALKIRLPGVKKTFLEDAQSITLLARWATPLVKELDINQIVAQLVQMTTEELDFRHEAENLKRFAKLPHDKYIRVPQLHEKLSSEALLVTNWEEGQRLREYLDAHPEEAAHLLNLLLGSYLQQVTRFGIFQADPHPGNFLVNGKGEIVILDYGAMGRLSSNEVKSYSRLLYGLMGFLGPVNIGELFVEAGFIGGSPEVLQSLAEYVFTDKLKHEQPVLAIEEIMKTFRENRILIPDSYVALSRVLITLGGFMLNYNVPMDWTPPEKRSPV